MMDMEKLYIKENKPNKRGRDLENTTDFGKPYRSCRSNSLKNRMLMITLNKNNKHEWIILPQLPSKVGTEDEVLR
jgi:hypothetical protein